MTTLGLFDRSIAIRTLYLATGTFMAPFLIAGAVELRINLSPSLPLGLYRVTADIHAPLIEFCPPEPYGSFAALRGFRSAGNCPDGASPLMKPVIAIAGDLVDVSDAAGIAVNGSTLPNTAAKTKDSHGRPLSPFPSGRYRVQPGFVWVASSYNPWSFDSRYFGPVQAQIIRRHLKPFLTL